MTSRWPWLALLSAAALAFNTGARPARYTLPTERPIDLPAGPGADLAAAYCAACHSFDYVTTQPRNKGSQFWRDSVAKMIIVYGAPIPPAEAKQISAYLAATYGGTPR